MTCSLLEKLGFIINKEKCQLIPATRCKYLGFVLVSTRFVFELPDKKRLATKSMIERLQPGIRWTIWEFANLIGKLISCCPAIAYGILYAKNLEREKQLIINDES